MRKQKKVIIISGYAGSGKSTLSNNLARYFGLECVHASDLLRQLKSKSAGELVPEKSREGTGWWESKQGEAYLKKRAENGSMDRELDGMLLKIIEKGGVVLDSWTMPWLSRKGFKIWLEVPRKERARRVAFRDKLDEKEVHEKIRARDEKTAAIYRKIYGFEFGKDLKPFDLVIKGEKLTADQAFEKAKNALEKYFKA